MNGTTAERHRMRHGHTAPDLDGLDTARLDELRELVPGDTSYLERAIGNFERNSTAAPDELRHLIDTRDPVQLRAYAHRLLGSALNLGAGVAVPPLRVLEDLGDRRSTEGALDVMPEVEITLARARAQLLAYLDLHTDSGAHTG